LLDEEELVVDGVDAAAVVAAPDDVVVDAVAVGLDAAAVFVLDTSVCWPIEAIDEMLAICIV
jgi:hypothetical protein